MKVTPIREITGEELIHDLERTYGSINKLEKIYDRNPENMKIYMDLDNWKYYSTNLEEVIKDSKNHNHRKTKPWKIRNGITQLH